MSLKYEPASEPGSAAHSCEIVVFTLRTVPIGTAHRLAGHEKNKTMPLVDGFVPRLGMVSSLRAANTCTPGVHLWRSFYEPGLPKTHKPGLLKLAVSALPPAVHPRGVIATQMPTCKSISLLDLALLHSRVEVQQVL